MESKVYKKNMKDYHVRMLPRAFKFAGWGIALLVILSVILQKIFHFGFVAEWKEIKSYCLSLFSLGLLLVAWAKDKVEDERTRQMKINALALSFIFGAIYAIATPFLYLVFADPLLQKTGLGLIAYVLVMHVSLFYMQKFNDWYDEKKRRTI